MKRTWIAAVAVAAVLAAGTAAQADLAGRITAALAGKTSKPAGRIGVCVTLMPSGNVWTMAARYA